MTRHRHLLLLAGLLCIPATAFANAGTPLIWAAAFHLVVGNALIGLIEGLLLAWFFKAPVWRSILLLIPANYASAWIGSTLIHHYLARQADLTIETLRYWFLFYVVATFFITILIELPFFWLALRTGKRPLVSALLATPLIHCISYTLLFTYYWSASVTSMMTRLDVVPPAALRSGTPYTLYYLSAKGDQVLRADLDGKSPPEIVQATSAPGPNDRLFARSSGNAKFDLYLATFSEEHNDEKETLLMESFAYQAPIDWLRLQDSSLPAVTSWMNFGPVPSLAKDTHWKFTSGFWGAGGIQGENQTENKSLRYALELPFRSWPIRNATHLEGDLLVFQLGNDQICLMNPLTKKITLLARGKGPIVVKPNPL